MIARSGDTSSAFDWRTAFAAADRIDPGTGDRDARQKRGRAFEAVLVGALAEAGLDPRGSLRPSGEELDGSFVMDGRFHLLEAKWTAAPQPASSLYQFKGKVDGKLVGTIGVFISMSGFSTDAVDALRVGKELNLVLFDGNDVRAMVDGRVPVKEALARKLRAAAEYGAVFFPLTRDVAVGQAHEPSKTTTVVVEGRFDERIIRALIELFGPPVGDTQIVSAGGPFNMVNVAAAVSGNGQDSRVLLVADGDNPTLDIGSRIDAQLREIWDDERDLPRIFVAQPTLEEVVGLPADMTHGERTRLMLGGGLKEAISKGATRGGSPSAQLTTLLRELGISAPRRPSP